MKNKVGNFLGIFDTKIYYRVWSPEEASKGVILIIHGYGEHSNRYLNVVNTLVPEGYSIWALDHRGHGKSEGRRCYVNRFTDFFSDIDVLENLARKENPDLPFHMVGHSMGSIIANHYMATRADQSKYSSLTLSGTGAAPGPAINALTRIMSKIFSVLLPKISIPSGLDPQFISHDAKVVEDYINDPLVENKITPRLGNELMVYVSRMLDVAPSISVPTLMQLGSEDDAFHPDSWNNLYNSIGSKEKEFKIYDGYRHEVYNEVKKEVPLGDLKDWINKYNSI